LLIKTHIEVVSKYLLIQVAFVSWSWRAIYFSDGLERKKEGENLNSIHVLTSLEEIK
jgi:hypothetical protein